MKCPKCQHLNDSAAKFCAECASPLARTCASCGNPLPPTAKFCPECAHPTGLATATQSSYGAPETYTPKHLVAKILNSRAAIEGERKQVTVLFADLKGSMELLADRDPEEARKLLDPVLELMIEAVHHYEGTVNQAAGDGIMALFGAPLAHEDHAVRACYAALRMQKRAKRHAEAVFRTHGVNLQIRVGLNSGDVVVGTVGSDLRMDYTAIGRTTHLAARMEQLARPGSILMTPSTLELVDGFVTVKSLGPVPIKGLIEPLEVHEVTGVGPVRTRFQSVARRGLTPFVGRERELEQLRQAQRLAGKGQGQVVALVAEAGMGKSRVVYELAHSPVLEGWRVMECAAVSYGKAMSYLPVTNLLKGYFEIIEQDSLQTVSDKVKTKLLALDGALAPTLPALLALLNAPVNDPAWETLDPAERRRRMLDGVRYLLLQEARQRPLLLIFEDLHWIDNETQAVLDSLVECLGSARVLLLATYRPEYQHGWAGKTYYSQLRLDALAGDSRGQLLDVLLGDDPTLSSLKQLLVNHGNPFFLEEIVRALVETKALEGSSGSYRLIRPIEAVRVPATVQVILASRIDRLSLEDKHLLQIAAVTGRSVPVSLLRAVADLPDEALRDGLRRLQAAEFVYFTGLLPTANFLFRTLTPDIEYSFKHALTQEVAYGGMLQERRRDLHARIVEAIETLHHDRLDEQIELLAYHALRSELREKAVSYLFQAGLKAAKHSAPDNAKERYEQALGALEALPDSRYKLEQSFEIRLELRSVLSILGETRMASGRLREAEIFAETLNDERRLGRVCAMMASNNCQLAELDEAFANASRALTIAEGIGDTTLRGLAVSNLGMLYYYRAEYGRAVAVATDLAVTPDYYASNLPGPISTHCWRIRSLVELGRFSTAAAHANEMLQLAEPTRGAFAVGMAYLTAGWRLLAQGVWAHARPLIERGVAEYRKGNIFLALPHAVASSAQLLAQLGEASEALSRLQEGEELLKHRTAGGTIDQAGMDYHWLGRAAFLLGKLDDARRLANCSLQYSPSHPGFAAHALHLLGDIAIHPEEFDIEEGELHYRKALALAEPRGMRPVIAHCHFGLGKLYQRTGISAQAREHLTTATTMYREMDMRFYLEQAEAEK
jgi:class 3 adenylate cyclase/tetratricopeptide (TPR) repeat protein